MPNFFDTFVKNTSSYYFLYFLLCKRGFVKNSYQKIYWDIYTAPGQASPLSPWLSHHLLGKEDGFSNLPHRLSAVHACLTNPFKGFFFAQTMVFHQHSFC